MFAYDTACVSASNKDVSEAMLLMDKTVRLNANLLALKLTDRIKAQYSAEYLTL